MIDVTNHPLLVFVLSFAILWVATRIGAGALNRRNALAEASREDFDVILGATLTLLGLIIGFTFSMAINRYDQRKVYEESEANAIGTEFVRADLLPSADAAKVRKLLRDYLDQRVLFYTTRDEDTLARINVRMTALQNELWSAVVTPATAQPTPLTALAVAGMNDVLNSQGYAQAAWWNRIPLAAWILMAAIAIGSNVMVGYGARNAKALRVLILVLPLLVSVSFFMIADIDSPRWGVIRVTPQNLNSLAASLPAS